MPGNDSAPALLVPVDVSAMVVTGRPRNFQRWTMNYGQLAYALTPEPAPFRQVDDAFSRDEANLGVYLAWTLPDALRRGARDPRTGEMVFPPVPNRWLVVRVHGDGDAVPPAAWVVESDYVWPADGGPDGTPADGAPFLDPAPGLDAPRPTQVGRRVPLGPGGWTEPGHPAGWLTAVGPGNVAFAAFQPHNPNVFSLHDALGTLGVPDGTLSYFVAGWYSRPDDDPLAGEDPAHGAEPLAARLAALGWTAPPGVLEGPPPRRILCHGMAAAVRWERDGDLAPALPWPGGVRLAVGNTAVDAFAALVDDGAGAAGAPPGAAARLVEGALHDALAVLDQPDGDARLERLLRDAWFGSSPSGSRWEVAAAEPRPGDPPAPPPPAARRAAEAALLRPLNAAQAALDEARRRLDALRADLYALWWKSVRAPRVFQEIDPGRYPAGTSAAQFAAALAAAGAESRPARVAAALDEVERLGAEVDRRKDGVRRALAEPGSAPSPGPARVLKEVADARFWKAGDPVVVLSGARHAGTLLPRAVRACRTVDGLVAGLRIDLPGGGAAIAGADAAPAPRLPLGGLPPEVGPLLREFALLAPENAPVLAAALGVGGTRCRPCGRPSWPPTPPRARFPTTTWASGARPGCRSSWTGRCSGTLSPSGRTRPGPGALTGTTTRSRRCRTWRRSRG
ncbi:hypothetical protein [Longimicrobium sp.]|uniref:hypothetical protein n=1 Tax=Longimicrobium sp. TaxID=2029185 RepID=UPI002E38112A|nr:hypothetical protein [Longimicrobium sp.]HEX6036988.1 hypothetical protein [Longimicrobium sp.]